MHRRNFLKMTGLTPAIIALPNMPRLESLSKPLHKKPVIKPTKYSIESKNRLVKFEDLWELVYVKTEFSENKEKYQTLDSPKEMEIIAGIELNTWLYFRDVTWYPRGHIILVQQYNNGLSSNYDENIETVFHRWNFDDCVITCTFSENNNTLTYTNDNGDERFINLGNLINAEWTWKNA